MSHRCKAKNAFWFVSERASGLSNGFYSGHPHARLSSERAWRASVFSLPGLSHFASYQRACYLLRAATKVCGFKVERHFLLGSLSGSFVLLCSRYTCLDLFDSCICLIFRYLVRCLLISPLRSSTLTFDGLFDSVSLLGVRD